MYLPDSFGILAYSLKRLNSTAENLIFNKEVISNRVFDNYTYLSSYYLHHLIEHTDIKRDNLYSIVQEASFEAAKHQSANAFHESLQDLLKKEGVELQLPSPDKEEIKKIFLRSTDDVFKRVLLAYPEGKDL
jgi:adenylosuccinate lyase